MTSNGLVETLNHIQYNPTTYAKGKYAYVFQGQRNVFQYPSWNGFEDTILEPIRQYSDLKRILSKYFTLIITGQLYMVNL